MPFRCASGDFTHNEEPTLDALLAEPIVRLVMARDRVAEDHIRQLADAVLRQSRSLREWQHGRLPPGSQGPHCPTD
jgi:hypothetical protein